jgi:hypothetical protein
MSLIWSKKNPSLMKAIHTVGLEVEREPEAAPAS